MTEKELKKLNRRDILELLVKQTKEADRLRSELRDAYGQLADTRDCISRLKDKLDGKDAKIVELAEKLDAKDVKIARLAAKLDAKDARIAQLGGESDWDSGVRAETGDNGISETGEDVPQETQTHAGCSENVEAGTDAYISQEADV